MSNFEWLSSLKTGLQQLQLHGMVKIHFPAANRDDIYLSLLGKFQQKWCFQLLTGNQANILQNRLMKASAVCQNDGPVIGLRCV